MFYRFSVLTLLLTALALQARIAVSIQSLQQPRCPAAPRHTIQVVNIDRQELARLRAGLDEGFAPVRDGLWVSEVRHGGLAEVLGLQKGDLLRRIDGQPARTRALYAASPHPGFIQIELDRGIDTVHIAVLIHDSTS